MTKRDVKDIAQAFNCEALYSGKERTMYIHGVDEYLAVAAINNNYQSFTVVAGRYAIIGKGSRRFYV